MLSEVMPETRCHVVVWLPRAGLGNKLYLWAKGWVFARLNQGQFHCFGWTQLKLGPILRSEKCSRLYWDQLRRETLIAAVSTGFHWLTSHKVIDPPVERVSLITGKTTFIFREIHAHLIPQDSFRSLVDFRDALREELLSQLTPRCQESLEATPAPLVGIHIRRGDFRHFNWWTPIESFCARLQAVRKLAGACLAATIYSDGTLEELQPLLSMERVTLAPSNPDIVDLLLFSRSRIMITSRASTFSNMAAFLSDGVVLRDPLFCHQSSRPAAVNTLWYEGSVSETPGTWPELAKHNIRQIGRSSIPGSIAVTVTR